MWVRRQRRLRISKRWAKPAASSFSHSPLASSHPPHCIASPAAFSHLSKLPLACACIPAPPPALLPARCTLPPIFAVFIPPPEAGRYARHQASNLQTKQNNSASASIHKCTLLLDDRIRCESLRTRECWFRSDHDTSFATDSKGTDETMAIAGLMCGRRSINIVPKCWRTVAAATLAAAVAAVDA